MNHRATRFSSLALTAAVAAGLCSAGAFAQSATCADAPSVTVGANAFDNAAVTTSQLVTNATGGTETIQKAAWFKFTPTVTSNYDISVCNSVNDTKLGIGAACPTGATTAWATLGYNDDFCACASGCGGLNYASRIVSALNGAPLALTAGTTYYICVGSWGTNTGAVSGTMTITTVPDYTPCNPSNPTITVANGSNSVPWLNDPAAPTLTATATGCSAAGDLFKTQYYKFTPTLSGPYTFTACNSSAALTRRLLILSDCAPTATVLACGNSTTTTPCTTSGGWTATATLTAGQPVYVVVGATTGTINLGPTVTVTGFGPYDACVEGNKPANTWQGYGIAGGTTTTNPPISYRGDALVPDMTIPGCGVIYKANVYKYNPLYTGAYQFRTCNTSVAAERRLAVLSGCDPATATLIGCGTAAATTTCANGGQIAEFNLTAGVPVYFVIGGASATTNLGTNVNTVVFIGPNNPECESAVAAPFGTSSFQNPSTPGLNVSAVVSPATTQFSIFNPTWRTFRPQVTGAYTIATCGAVGDTEIAIGTACGRLGLVYSAIATNDDGCTNTSGSNFASRMPNVALTAGVTYRIVIGQATSATTPYSGTLSITGPAQPPFSPCAAADLNSDGLVNGADLGLLLSAWGPCAAPCPADINNDGSVNGADLGSLLGAWGPCP